MFWKKGCPTVQKIGKNTKFSKVGKIGSKYYILTVQEKQIAHRGNKKNNPWNDSISKRDRGIAVKGIHYAHGGSKKKKLLLGIGGEYVENYYRRSIKSFKNQKSDACTW